MKQQPIVFDSGPVISLTMNNLLWVLTTLKKDRKNPFYITKAVEEELIEKPLNTTKRFQFEAIQVARAIHQKTLEVYPKRPKQTQQLLDLANNCYTSKGTPLRIIHEAEMEILALACELNATAVIDERTVRLLIEDPKSLQELLKRRLHKNVTINTKKVKQFHKELCNVPIIRSAELATVAFTQGILDSYIPKITDGKKRLLDAVLWGLKSNGCAITSEEIEEVKRIVLKK